MKINNPNQIHKQKHPKWTKMDHRDEVWQSDGIVYFGRIITRWVLDTGPIGVFDNSLFKDITIKEKHQPRTPANAPNQRMYHLKMHNYE